MDKNGLISKLFKEWSGKEPISIKAFPKSGSNREYYRISSSGKTAIAVYNENKKENETFIYFSNHFKSKGLPVPEMYCADLRNHVYLQEDLGSKLLFDMLMQEQKQNIFSGDLVLLYKKSINQLIRFQIEGHHGLDYAKCFPGLDYGLRYMKWDLNYFKYYFMKMTGLEFDENLLEMDFDEIADFLLKYPSGYFLYRDFQTRNILIKNNEPFFVDYQGGRKGALPYDLASLLYQAKAKMPDSTKNELLEYYIARLNERVPTNPAEFKTHFYGFALIRIMQTLGAYGYRGYYERKAHFVQSLELGFDNLKNLLANPNLVLKIPYIRDLIAKAENQPLFNGINTNSNRLTVKISSFSYKKSGMPMENSEHGGGFVFDCRFLPNPGREQKYRSFSGKDSIIIDYFKSKPEMDKFLNYVYGLVGQSIENYLERKFNSLSVCFGCTGGQHRSVYSAEKLATFLKQKYDVDVLLYHKEEKSWRK